MHLYESQIFEPTKNRGRITGVVRMLLVHSETVERAKDQIRRAYPKASIQTCRITHVGVPIVTDTWNTED